MHPQSVIHSLVEYVDGSVLAQLGHPDMRTPIAQALAYPERIDAGVPTLDFARLCALAFEAPDVERFPCLRLAYEALRAGGTAPAALNAANEIAVAAFLAGRIRFTDIAAACAATLSRTPNRPLIDLDDARAADAQARSHAGLGSPARPFRVQYRHDRDSPTRCSGSSSRSACSWCSTSSATTWSRAGAASRCLRFSVGFGRVIAARRFGRDQTEWALSAIPLGGYVKMADEREGDVAPEDLPRAFNRQNVWKRIAIVAAGPIANLLLAVVLFAGTYMAGIPGQRALLAEPPPGTPAAAAGIRAGDLVVALDGEPVQELAGLALAPHQGAGTATAWRSPVEPAGPRGRSSGDAHARHRAR